MEQFEERLRHLDSSKAQLERAEGGELPQRPDQSHEDSSHTPVTPDTVTSAPIVIGSPVAAEHHLLAQDPADADTVVAAAPPPHSCPGPGDRVAEGHARRQHRG